MRLYISGPMRGIPCYNFPEFDSLAAYLKNHGYEYINPADHDREVEPGVEQTEHYRLGENTDRVTELLGWDLAQIASPECDGVVMLPGWENSTGAQHERYVAEACGKAVFLAKKTQMHGLWTIEGDPDRSLSAKRETIQQQWDAAMPASLQPTPTPVTGMKLNESQYPSARRPVSFSTEPDPVTDIRAQGHAFTTKDSGARVNFDSGMVRDTDEGKPRYDLIPLLPLRRLAELLARGASKYGPRNWEQASSQEELDRFKASAFRHLAQWLDGDTDEDHASAIVFNVWAATVTEQKLVRETD